MKTLKIIFVEDDPDDRELISDCLLFNGFPNYLILDSGPNLFSYLENVGAASLPDLIVVDMNMPQMSGYDVIRQLKQHPLYQLIPVFILTTTYTSPVVEKSIAAGAAGYYKKPNSIAALNGILKELCEMAVD
jgi:CheY-like chemotaxis protein